MKLFVILFVCALAISSSFAYDPSPLQDICVAIAEPKNAGLSSQNPGVITIANAVFGAKPPINPDVLTKAFQVDKKVIDYLQSQFWYDNN
ncbi:hypothetical protein CRG98_027132 [Punica granatum]|uniref:Cupin type-1 domain-containing protein n=1 Tax=Punica granatum TaxID=22663 RepID=A0A2I0J9A1_PUNGR|nr:hypothetical protein CRG98_027132 [Punica granatum]